MGFRAYQDDAAVLTVAGLTIENGTDRLAMYGDLELRADRRGLEHARVLRAVLADAIGHLEKLSAAGRLPERLDDDAPPPASVDNPFA